jgi:DNA-binding NarL/FixJ family response regulator
MSIVARSHKEAVEAERYAETLDLLIIDHSLPPDRGRDIAERVRQWHSSMKVLQISGYF